MALERRPGKPFEVRAGAPWQGRPLESDGRAPENKNIKHNKRELGQVIRRGAGTWAMRRPRARDSTCALRTEKRGGAQKLLVGMARRDGSGCGRSGLISDQCGPDSISASAKFGPIAANIGAQSSKLVRIRPMSARCEPSVRGFGQVRTPRYPQDLAPAGAGGGIGLAKVG